MNFNNNIGFRVVGVHVFGISVQKCGRVGFAFENRTRRRESENGAVGRLPFEANKEKTRALCKC